VTLRVLHIIATDQRRGAEIFAADLMRALEEQEVVQKAVVLRGGDANGDTGNDRFLGLLAVGPAVPGLNVHVSIVRRLASAIADWRPDVIQAHGGEALKYAVLATARRRKPIVYRRIGTSPGWIRKGPRRLAHAALMRRAARVVTVADAVRAETIQRFRVPAMNVVTIPNAVDPRRLEPAAGRVVTRDLLAIPPSSLVVLSVGALTWEKDPLALVEVGRRVLARVPDALHVFVGEGPMRRETQQAAIKSGLGDRIRFLGSRNDVADILAAGDVLLLASRSDGMEGMPANAIEAGMAGLPVAAYAVAGVPEVVVDGTTGLLAPPGDVEGLEQRVVALLRDAALRRRVGAEARARCRTSFDVKLVAPLYLGIYEEVARTT
jgi:glycosyltransferase involved in cell wall biosynthesis